MRNLKRALSLALATVMTLGLMVVGTGAVGYEDVTSEDNVEAIEVLQAVGIMTGDENGNFNPDNLVTRNEMAVVMSQLLNLNYNYYRGTNPFTDVPSWAAPYVAACAAEGVTSGIGDGLYGGDQNVTAAQAALMILKALGYFQYQADFEGDWQVTTIRQASYINLFDGIDASAEEALTRNQIAQLVLNGLKSNLVEFTGNVGATVGDVVIGHNTQYTARTNAAQKYNSIDVGTTNIAANDQYYIQLGEELYDGDLVLRNTNDPFGRPARYWEYDGDEVGTYVKNELLREEYTAAVTGRDLYELLGKATIEDYLFEIYIDGEDEEDILNAFAGKKIDDVETPAYYFTEGNMVRSNTDAVGGTGDGVLTQVYVDTTAKKVTVAVINTYLAKASSDYNEKTGEVDFDIYGIDDAGRDQYVKRYSSVNKDLSAADDDFAVEDVAKGDLFLVTVAEGAIQTLAEPEILSDTTLNSFRVDSYVRADGTQYDFADTIGYDDAVLDAYTDGGSNINLKDITYNLILDPYGYLIGIEQNEDPNQYLFVTGFDGNYSNIATRTADMAVIYLDGTMDTIEVNVRDSDPDLFTRQSAYYNDGSKGAKVSHPAIINTWCTYTVDKNGVYTLEVAEDQSREDIQKGSPVTIDVKHITRKNADGGYVVGNDDTVYLNVDMETVDVSDTKTAYIIYDVDSVTTGVKNVNIEVSDKTTGYSATFYKPQYEIYTLYDGGYITAVVTMGEDQGVSTDYAYVTSDNVVREDYDSTSEEWTWTREVVIDGEITEITYVGDRLSVIKPGDGDGDTDDEMDQGYWYKVSYYADGTVKGVESLMTEFGDTTTDTDRYISDVVSIEDSFDAYNGDTLVLWDARTDLNSSNSSHGTNVNYLHFENGSLYTVQNYTTGFSVHPDVKVVVANADGKSKAFATVEDGYTGYDGLEDALDDLNGNFQGDISAIFEGGVATSIIINCTAPDKGFNAGDTETNGDYAIEYAQITSKGGFAVVVSNGETSTGSGIQNATIELQSYISGKWENYATYSKQDSNTWNTWYDGWQFDYSKPGTAGEYRAIVTVDGETLTSESFMVP